MPRIAVQHGDSPEGGIDASPSHTGLSNSFSQRSPNASQPSSPRSNPPGSPKYRWNPYTSSGAVDEQPTATVSYQSPNHGPSSLHSSFALEPMALPPNTAPPRSSGSPVATGSPGGLSSPRDGEEMAWNSIIQLRQIKKDTGLLPQMSSLPPEVLDAIHSYLLNHPELFIDLCERERGNIVVQLIDIKGPRECHHLYSMVFEHSARLLTNQSGCIAYTRLYEAAHNEHRRQMASIVISRFQEFAVHPYGNYVVQRVIQDAVPEEMRLIEDSIIAGMPSSVPAFAGNKFGSHVLQSFLTNADREVFQRIFLAILRNDEVAHFMCQDNFANYVLQHAMRKAAEEPAFKDECIELVKPWLQDSPYAQNIVKSWSGNMHYPGSPHRSQLHSPHGSFRRSNPSSPVHSRRSSHHASPYASPPPNNSSFGPPSPNMLPSTGSFSQPNFNQGPMLPAADYGYGQQGGSGYNQGYQQQQGGYQQHPPQYQQSPSGQQQYFQQQQQQQQQPSYNQYQQQTYQQQQQHQYPSQHQYGQGYSQH